jgi:hypothetical protein
MAGRHRLSLVSSTNPTVDDLITMVQTTRAYGLPGTVIWYDRCSRQGGAHQAPADGLHRTGEASVDDRRAISRPSRSGPGARTVGDKP